MTVTARRSDKQLLKKKKNEKASHRHDHLQHNNIIGSKLSSTTCVYESNDDQKRLGKIRYSFSSSCILAFLMIMLLVLVIALFQAAITTDSSSSVLSLSDSSSSFFLMVNAQYILKDKIPETCMEALTKYRYEKNVLSLSNPTLVVPPSYPSSDINCGTVGTRPYFRLRLSFYDQSPYLGSYNGSYYTDANLKAISEPFNFISTSELFRSSNYQTASTAGYLSARDVFVNAKNFSFISSGLVLADYFYTTPDGCQKVAKANSVDFAGASRISSIYNSKCNNGGDYDTFIGYSNSIKLPPVGSLEYNLLRQQTGDKSYLALGYNSTLHYQTINSTLSQTPKNVLLLYTATCSGTDECSGNGVCLSLNEGCSCFSPYYGPFCNNTIQHLKNVEIAYPTPTQYGGCKFYISTDIANNQFSDMCGGNAVNTVGSVNYITGASGKALEFGPESSSRADVLNFPFPSTKVTVAFWLLSESEGNHLEQGAPFAYQVNNTYFGFVLTDYRSLKVSINEPHVLRYLFTASNSWDTTVNINSKTWRHVAVSWSSDSGLLKLYIDGTLKDFKLDYKKGQKIPPNGTLTIGNLRSPGSGNVTFFLDKVTGAIDEFVIFDRVLTDNEIGILATPSTFCFGVSGKNSSVCSGRGSCVSFDTCSCTTPHSYGTNCEFCDTGYGGSTCKRMCGGLPFDDPLVCNGRGSCNEPEKCTCQYGYKFGGNYCQDVYCHGMINGCVNGNCTVVPGTEKLPGDNLCVCNPNFYNDPADNACKFTTCNGILSIDGTVCNLRGNCVAKDVCVCTNTFFGGQFCDQKICYGLLEKDENACSGRGICGDFGYCSCFISGTPVTNDCACLNLRTGRNCELGVPSPSQVTSKFPDNLYAIIDPNNSTLQFTVRSKFDATSVSITTYQNALHCIYRTSSSSVSFKGVFLYASRVTSDTDENVFDITFNCTFSFNSTAMNISNNGNLTLAYKDRQSATFSLFNFTNTYVGDLKLRSDSNIMPSSDSDSVEIKYDLPFSLRSQVYLLLGSSWTALSYYTAYPGYPTRVVAPIPAGLLSNSFGIIKAKILDYSLDFIVLNSDATISYQYPSFTIENTGSSSGLIFSLLIQNVLPSNVSNFQCLATSDGTLNQFSANVQSIQAVSQTSSLVTCGNINATDAGSYVLELKYKGRTASRQNIGTYRVGKSLGFDMISSTNVIGSPFFVTNDVGSSTLSIYLKFKFSGAQYSYSCVSVDGSISSASFNGNSLNCTVSFPPVTSPRQNSVVIRVKESVMTKSIPIYNVVYYHGVKESIITTSPNILQSIAGRVSGQLSVQTTKNNTLEATWNYYCLLNGQFFTATYSPALSTFVCSIDITLNNPVLENGIFYADFGIYVFNGISRIPITSSYLLPIASDSITIDTLDSSGALFVQSTQSFTINNFKLNKAKFNCLAIQSATLKNYEDKILVSTFPIVIDSNCQMTIQYNPSIPYAQGKYSPMLISPSISITYGSMQTDIIAVSTSFYFVTKYLSIAESFPSILDYATDTTDLKYVFLGVTFDATRRTNIQYKCRIGSTLYDSTILSDDMVRCEISSRSTLFTGINSPSERNITLEMTKDTTTSKTFQLDISKTPLKLPFDTIKPTPNYIESTQLPTISFKIISKDSFMSLPSETSFLTYSLRLNFEGTNREIGCNIAKTTYRIVCTITTGTISFSKTIQTITATLYSSFTIAGVNYKEPLTTLSFKIVAYQTVNVDNVYPKVITSDTVSNSPQVYLSFHNSYDSLLGIDWKCLTSKDVNMTLSNAPFTKGQTISTPDFLLCDLDPMISSKVNAGVVQFASFFNVTNLLLDSAPLQVTKLSSEVYYLQKGNVSVTGGSNLFAVSGSFSVPVSFNQTIPYSLIANNLVYCMLSNANGYVLGTITVAQKTSINCAFIPNSNIYGKLTLSINYFENVQAISKTFQSVLSANTDQELTVVPTVNIQSVSMYSVQTSKQFSIVITTAFNTSSNFGEASFGCVWNSVSDQSLNRVFPAKIINEGVFNCTEIEHYSGIYQLSIGLSLQGKPYFSITNTYATINVIGGSFLSPTTALYSGGTTATLYSDFIDQSSVSVSFVDEPTRAFTCSLIAFQTYSCIIPDLRSSSIIKPYYQYNLEIKTVPKVLSLPIVPYSPVDIIQVNPPFVIDTVGVASSVITLFSSSLTLGPNSNLTTVFDNEFNLKLENNIPYNLVQGVTSSSSSFTFSNSGNYRVSVSTKYLLANNFPFTLDITANKGNFQVLKKIPFSIASGQSDILLVNSVSSVSFVLNYGSLVVPSAIVKNNLYCKISTTLYKATVTALSSTVDQITCSITYSQVGSVSADLFYYANGSETSITSSPVTLYFENTYSVATVTPQFTLNTPQTVQVSLNSFGSMENIVYKCAISSASALTAVDAFVVGNVVTCPSLTGSRKTFFDIYAITRAVSVPFKITSNQFALYFETVKTISFTNPYLWTINDQLVNTIPDFQVSVSTIDVVETGIVKCVLTLDGSVVASTFVTKIVGSDILSCVFSTDTAVSKVNKMLELRLGIPDQSSNYQYLTNAKKIPVLPVPTPIANRNNMDMVAASVFNNGTFVIPYDFSPQNLQISVQMKDESVSILSGIDQSSAPYFVAPYVGPVDNLSPPTNYIPKKSVPFVTSFYMNVANKEISQSNTQVETYSLVVYDLLTVQKISPFVLTTSDISIRDYSYITIYLSKYSLNTTYSFNCYVKNDNDGTSYQTSAIIISSTVVKCKLAKTTKSGFSSVQLVIDGTSNFITDIKKILVLDVGFPLSLPYGTVYGGQNVTLTYSNMFDTIKSINHGGNSNWMSQYSFTLLFIDNKKIMTPLQNCQLLTSSGKFLNCLTPNVQSQVSSTSKQYYVVLYIDGFPSMTLISLFTAIKPSAVSSISPSIIDASKTSNSGTLSIAFASTLDSRLVTFAVKYRSSVSQLVVSEGTNGCVKKSATQVDCPLPTILSSNPGFLFVDFSFDDFSSYITLSQTVEIYSWSGSIGSASPATVDVYSATLVSINVLGLPRNTQPKIKLNDNINSKVLDGTYNQNTNQITFTTVPLTYLFGGQLPKRIPFQLSLDNGYSFGDFNLHLDFAVLASISISPTQAISGSAIKVSISGVSVDSPLLPLQVSLRINKQDTWLTSCSISGLDFCLDSAPSTTGTYSVVVYSQQKPIQAGSLTVNVIPMPTFSSISPSLVFSSTPTIKVYGSFSSVLVISQIQGKLQLKSTRRAILGQEIGLSPVSVTSTYVELSNPGNAPSGSYDLLLSFDSGSSFNTVNSLTYSSGGQLTSIDNITPDFVQTNQILTIVPNSLMLHFSQALPCGNTNNLQFTIATSSSFSSLTLSLQNIINFYQGSGLSTSDIFTCVDSSLFILYPPLNNTLPDYSILEFPFATTFTVTFNGIDTFSLPILIKSKYDEPRIINVQPYLLERNIPTSVTIVGENLGAAVGCQFSISNQIVRVAKVLTSVSSEINCEIPSQIITSADTSFYVQLYNSRSEYSNSYNLYIYDRLKVLNVNPKKTWTYDDIPVTLQVEGITQVVNISKLATVEIRAMFGTVISTDVCTVMSENIIMCIAPKREKGLTSISLSVNRREWYSLNGEGFTYAAFKNGSSNTNALQLSSDAKSMFEYVPCMAGYGASSYRDVCQECKPGFYKPINDSNACIPCDFNTYSSSFQAKECISCPVNTLTLQKASTSLTECICQNNYYLNPSPKKLDDYCVKCNEQSMICNAGNNIHPYPKKGYWMGKHDNYTVYSCLPIEACGGFSIENCTVGYISGKCGACDVGYYKFNGFCTKCGDDAIWRLIGFGILMLVVVLIFLLISSIKLSHLASISIALSFFQVVAMFTKYNVKWPVVMEYSYTASSATLFNTDFINPKCIFPDINQLTKWYLTSLFPVYVFVLFVLLYILGILRNVIVSKFGHHVKFEYREPYRYHNDIDEVEYLKKKEEEKKLNKKQRLKRRIIENLNDWKIWFINLFVWLRNFLVWLLKEKMSAKQMKVFFNQLINGYTAFLSFTFAFIISQASDIFYCTPQPDNTCALVSSPDISILDPQWIAMLPLAIIYFVVFGLGSILFFLSLYIYKKHLKLEVRKDLLIHNPDLTKTELDELKWKPKNPVLLQKVKDFDLRFKFIQNRFKKRLFYWEIIITFRKLLLSIFNTFLLPLQTVTFALITVFIAFLLQSQFVPFKTKFHNLLEWVSLVCTELVLFFGLLFLVDDGAWKGNETLRGFCEWIASIVIVVSIVLVLGMLIYDIYVRRKKDRKKERLARRELERKYGKEKAKSLQALYSKLFGNPLTQMTKVVLLEDEEAQEKWNIIENPLCDSYEEFHDDWVVEENPLFIPDDVDAYARMNTSKRKVEFNLTLFESDSDSSDEDNSKNIRDIMEGLVNLRRIKKKIRLAKQKGGKVKRKFTTSKASKITDKLEKQDKEMELSHNLDVEIYNNTLSRLSSRIAMSPRGGRNRNDSTMTDEESSIDSPRSYSAATSYDHYQKREPKPKDIALVTEEIEIEEDEL
ncbi:predicted protein [Naegleria gruberi]|uniref:Predicted protein n=1 Tax=Naegleria gruberi TaxID=5762 RepID=D2VZE7_NAEGR|nr:uncharacterized protein NAEGRDRAFT_81819 [Naegleria gruberi]EFC37832.1 predicted protein [Naegleria gruberi]|eukprot:XP_002670576.1 predicted protein [Naegleria gruberi strain NEG-M]